MSTKVADASQPRTEKPEPGPFLPVNPVDLEAARGTATQSRSSSHFQVDTAAKLRRCFCCATLVLASLFQALMLDQLDPTAWKVALTSKTHATSTRKEGLNLIGRSAGPLVESLAKNLLPTKPPETTTTALPMASSSFGVLCLGIICWFRFV